MGVLMCKENNCLIFKITAARGMKTDCNRLNNFLHKSLVIETNAVLFSSLQERLQLQYFFKMKQLCSLQQKPIIWSLALLKICFPCVSTPLEQCCMSILSLITQLKCLSIQDEYFRPLNDNLSPFYFYSLN